MMRLPFNGYWNVLPCFLIGISLLFWNNDVINSPQGVYPNGEYYKVIKKESALSPYGAVHITNKYGLIEVEAWEKDRVKVAIDIVVRASSEYQAQKVFNRIKVAFSESSAVFAATTEILPDNQEWWFLGASDIQDDYEVNYKVYVPSDVQLKVNNRHGDIYLAGLNGQVTLDIQHGNIHSEDYLENADISIDDGYAYFRKVGTLKASLRQAKVKLVEAKYLEIDSRSSEVDSEEVAELNCRTKYDTYSLTRVGRFVNEGHYDEIEIEEAGEVDVKSKLSEVYIKKVNTSLHLHVDSSVVYAAKLGEDFRTVNLNGSFSDFRIGLPGLTTYQLDAVTNYAGIRYPKALVVAHKKDQGTRYELKGHMGESGKAPVIKARIKYGSLKLEED